jgi:hypothetical protein
MKINARLEDSFMTNFIDPHRMSVLLTGTNGLITGTNTGKFLATFFGN